MDATLDLIPPPAAIHARLQDLAGEQRRLRQLLRLALRAEADRQRRRAGRSRAPLTLPARRSTP